MRYAVKIDGKWYVAIKAQASEYGLGYNLGYHPECEVWCEDHNTAMICRVGEEDRVVELD